MVSKLKKFVKLELSTTINGGITEIKKEWEKERERLNEIGILLNSLIHHSVWVFIHVLRINKISKGKYLDVQPSKNLLQQTPTIITDIWSWLMEVRVWRLKCCHWL